MKKNLQKDGSTVVQDYTGNKVKYGKVEAVDKKMSSYEKAMDAMKQKPKMRGHE